MIVVLQSDDGMEKIEEAAKVSSFFQASAP
jgi:hypothetical protein